MTLSELYKNNPNAKFARKAWWDWEKWVKILLDDTGIYDLVFNDGHVDRKTFIENAIADDWFIYEERRMSVWDWREHEGTRFTVQCQNNKEKILYWEDGELNCDFGEQGALIITLEKDILELEGVEV